LSAAPLPALPDGRLILVLATSGHQVVTRWHGVPFDRPLQRIRETMAIVNQVLARQPVRFEGEVFRLTQGLKLLAHPVRPRVPVYLATITPAGVRLAAELADGWMPILYSPEHPKVFRADLEAGLARGGRDVSAVEIGRTMHLGASDDLARAQGALG